MPAERLALLGDVHANAAALRAVLTDVAGDGIERGVLTGDLVMRGEEPEECVAEVRRLGWPCVLGNTDGKVADGRRRDPDHPKAGRPGSRAWTLNRLSDESLEFLAVLQMVERVLLGPGDHRAGARQPDRPQRHHRRRHAQAPPGQTGRGARGPTASSPATPTSPWSGRPPASSSSTRAASARPCAATSSAPLGLAFRGAQVGAAGPPGAGTTRWWRASARSDAGPDRLPPDGPARHEHHGARRRRRAGPTGTRRPGVGRGRPAGRATRGARSSSATWATGSTGGRRSGRCSRTAMRASISSATAPRTPRYSVVDEPRCRPAAISRRSPRPPGARAR